MAFRHNITKESLIDAVESLVGAWECGERGSLDQLEFGAGR